MRIGAGCYRFAGTLRQLWMKTRPQLIFPSRQIFCQMLWPLWKGALLSYQKNVQFFETFFFSSVDFATETPAGQRVATYLRDTLVRPGYVAQGHAQVISWYFTLLLFSPLKSEDFVGAP